MDAIDLILAKRDGGRLGDDQIDWFIQSYTRGEVGDEQAAALLMAILFRGLDPDELVRWTEQMIASGERIDLGELGRPGPRPHGRHPRQDGVDRRMAGGPVPRGGRGGAARRRRCDPRRGSGSRPC